MDYAEQVETFTNGERPPMVDVSRLPTTGAWRWMDYAEQVQTFAIGERFTYADYRRLKRKPPTTK